MTMKRLACYTLLLLLLLHGPVASAQGNTGIVSKVFDGDSLIVNLAPGLPQDSSDDEIPEQLAIASASVEESEDSTSDTEEEQPVESDDATEIPSISEEAYVEEEPSAELTEADDDQDISEGSHAEEAQEIDDSPIEAVSQDDGYEEEKPDEVIIA